MLFYNAFITFIINLHIQYQHAFENTIYSLRKFYVFELEFLNDNNKMFLISQAKKSINREMIFQCLLTEAQVFNQEINKFTSDDYERFNSTLKVSSDFFRRRW